VDACNRLAIYLVLTDTLIVNDLATMITALAHEAGFTDWAAMTAWSHSRPTPAEQKRVNRRVRYATALDPATATHTTAPGTCARCCE